MNLAISGSVRSQTGLPPQLVLGKLNDTRTNDGAIDHTKGVLIVGTGEGTGVQPWKNGLRILDDGTVLIRPAGDLTMGTFDDGPTP